jgi:predicted ATP-dependent endonuclease of OLD family
MYLKYFQIVNYKNLKNARFKFCKGANTIIGENDSGKSNAMTAMRILLDNDYYFSIKKLRENDFSNSLDDWRGHWIILSAFFDEITAEDLENEICAELNPEQEDAAFLKSYIRCEGHGYGTITLFIRPGRSIRKALFSAKSSDEFNAIRSGITLRDYEFSFTSRSQADFTDPEIYKSIVGDIQSGKYANPDEEDARILGAHIDILNVWQHISLSFIDALRDAESEMHKPKNPLRRIFDTLQDEMQDKDIDAVLSKIHSLNESLSKIPQISNMGKEINKKLQDIVGLVYSPEIRVESRLKEDINSVARYLSLTPYGEEDIDELELGHLNILFIALKLLEFEANRNHEIYKEHYLII